MSAEQRSSSSQSASALQQPAIGSEPQPVSGSQMSSVHTSPSLHAGGGVPSWHMPVPTSHVSAPSQTSWLSQSSLLSQQVGMPVCTHMPLPMLLSQLSAVQTMKSLHVGGVPALHAPVRALQSSTPLQNALSSQTTGVPAHAPPLQTSPVVHLLSSSHDDVLLECPQVPVVVLQTSSVQTLSSLQLTGDPPTQALPLHVSTSVQALPSSHAPVRLTCWHPVVESQLSFVHCRPSSQSSGTLPAQVPPPQTSDVVQALPSLHAAVLLVCAQPVDALQLSSVHTCPSSQASGAPATQTPALQASFVVHTLLSLLQGVPSVLIGFEQAPPLHVPATWH